MASNILDAALLKQMFLAGVKNLESKKEWINELNVFPVPDGDTGTNMTLTILSAAKEVSSIDDPTMEELSKCISSGSLRGARGNSGVILSQLFRGFTKVIKSFSEINVEILAEALERATETAYKAVMKPKEGTILTVAKGISDKAREICADYEDDMDGFIQEILKEGDYVLSQTPELLPVLKQAGVVDSGGQGLMQVLKGCYDGYLGKEVSLDFDKPASASTGASAKEDIDTADIKFGYCTEFIIMTSRVFTHNDEKEFKAFLNSIGDSIVCVADEDLVKIHVHTNDPGLAIQKALTYGQLTRMKIDNMREEHQERVIKGAEKMAKQQAEEEEVQDSSNWKEYGFISVSAGSGIADIFRGLGVDYLIEGGQTMNPSTEDMLNAISKVPAKNIFILPNNSNIVMAAKQAKELTEDKEIFVIPTKTIPQGITAIINFAPDRSMEDNAEEMIEGIKNVKTGQITYAVRDTMIDDIEIHKDDIIGLGDKGMLADGKDINDVAVETVRKMLTEESELIGIYYGQDISEEQAEELSDRLSEEFPMVDIEVNAGNQPIYYYILSVE